jgi:hypothetical protein
MKTQTVTVVIVTCGSSSLLLHTRGTVPLTTSTTGTLPNTAISTTPHTKLIKDQALAGISQKTFTKKKHSN